MNKGLREIDNRLIELSREVDFYSLLTPVNLSEEKERFFQGLRKDKRYNPVFRYKPRDLSKEKRCLEELRGMIGGKDDMRSLFLKKINFMIGQLDLLTKGDTGFTGISERLYGAPQPDEIDFSLNILSEGRDEEYTFPEETVTPGQMSEALRKKLEDKGIDWTVALSDKIVPKISVSGKDKTIHINSRFNYTPQEVQRLEVHEVEVHAYRGANGDNQPFKIFREGLAGYDETEEGLAIVAEDIAGCLKFDTRQLKLYAGRYIGVSYSLGGSFYETFVKLREFFPDYLAYRLAERVKRGLEDTSLKGAFTQGLHYVSGLMKIWKYIANGGNLSILYVGKVGLEDVDAVSRLIEKGELKEPRFLPNFLDKF